MFRDTKTRRAIRLFDHGYLKNLLIALVNRFDVHEMVPLLDEIPARLCGVQQEPRFLG